MPPQIRLIRCLGALVVCLAAGAGAAETSSQSRPAEFEVEIGLGGEYDSNVSVSEVDQASNEGDYALIADASFEMKKELGERYDSAVTYDFSQTMYDEFSRVDRQTHILGADLARKGDVTDTGLSLYYINSRLDGKDFLDFYRLSPSLSGFVARNWFARGAYVYADKSIIENPDRDADTHSLELDLYMFRRGLRSYFNLGYRYKDENVEAQQYDYHSNSVKLRYIHRFNILKRLAKLELSWRYEDRDYSSITPSIGEDREDDRHRWRADLEVPLVGGSAVQLYYGYADYESNNASADYTQTLVGTRFFYRW